MTFAVGQVVATSEGRVGIVAGHYGRYLILMQIVRAPARKRSDVALDGRVHWLDTEMARSGHAAAGAPRLVPPSMVRLVGEAADTLMAACRKAQRREVEANDAPVSDSLAEVAVHVYTVHKKLSPSRDTRRVLPKPMAE